jgi:VWFA-related protein
MVVLAAAAITAAVARPQQLSAQQPSDPQRPTFRTGANIVRVDATVVDRPVTTLTAEDFAVFEDGVPQRIQSFKFVGATGLPPEGAEASLAIRSPEHAAAEAARDDVRVFLIFWDEYHIGTFESALRGRGVLEQFVLTALGPTDLVAVMDQLTPNDAIRFTRDRRALADTIHHLQGRRGIYFPTRSMAEEEHMRQPRYIEAIRAQVTASALEGAAIHLGALREGRKTIILVSETLGTVGQDTFDIMRALTNAANANNTAIVTVDPRGLGPRSSGLLQALSDSTGGRAIVNSNAPIDALRQVVRQASAYYLLGYESSHNPTDGGFHKIDVRLRPPELEVQARKGYWAPSVGDVARARAEAASAAPPEVTNALGTLARSAKDRRLFDTWIGVSRGVPEQGNVTVAWSPRLPAAGPDVPTRVTVTATANGGRTLLDATVAERRVSFVAPPGTVRLQITALNALDEIVDRESRDVEVPDYRAMPVALDVPAVVRIANPRDQRALLADPEAPPYAGRDFTKTDRLLVRFSAYWNGEVPPDIKAQLLSRSGAPLTLLRPDRTRDFSVQQPNARGGNYQIDLPLSSIARGEYVISIEAARGEDHAQALVPLRVVR